MTEPYQHSVLLEAILETQRKIEAAGHAIMREISAHNEALKASAYRLQLLYTIALRAEEKKNALDSERRLPSHKKGRKPTPSTPVGKRRKLRPAKRR